MPSASFFYLAKCASFFEICGNCYFSGTLPAPIPKGARLSSAHVSLSQHPQQGRDFLSRWIMSDLKIPFIAYSHTYLQLLTWLLCTQWESIKFT